MEQQHHRKFEEIQANYVCNWKNKTLATILSKTFTTDNNYIVKGLFLSSCVPDNWRQIEKPFSQSEETTHYIPFFSSLLSKLILLQNWWINWLCSREPNSIGGIKHIKHHLFIQGHVCSLARCHLNNKSRNTATDFERTNHGQSVTLQLESTGAINRLPSLHMQSSRAFLSAAPLVGVPCLSLLNNTFFASKVTWRKIKLWT